MRAHEAGAAHADAGDPSAVPLRPPADLNHLDPVVWPGSFVRRADGVVELAGHDVRELAATQGTPAFLLDEADFRRGPRVATAFEGADVYYAGKAFLCAAVARWVDEEGLTLDVCTGGELAVALHAGLPAGADRVPRQQQVASTSSTAPSRPASGAIVLDSFERDRPAGRASPSDAGVRRTC